MTGDPRLYWIQKNRVKSGRVTRVGSVVGRLAGELLETGTAHRIVKRIRAVVDDDFRRHCRVLVTSEGKMVVNVDEPGLVYTMRLRWAMALGRELGGILPAAGRGGIIFVHGRAGMRVSRS